MINSTETLKDNKLFDKKGKKKRKLHRLKLTMKSKKRRKRYYENLKKGN